MLIGRQQSRAASFDTAFVPGSPYFIPAPWDYLRKENQPPWLRKRIGFEVFKVVPFRWPTGNPVSLVGTSGMRSPWLTWIIIGVALYIGYQWYGRKLLRRRH